MRILKGSFVFRLCLSVLFAFGTLVSQAHSDQQLKKKGSVDAPRVLGEISFPTSTQVPDAQALFIEGMLLMHLFEYPLARNLFIRAQKLDPDFAMAYWAESMSHNKPIWDGQDLENGRNALAKFAETPELRLSRLNSEKERDYFISLDILYGEGDKASRDLSYMRHMKQMAKRYPDDHEVQLFYALSILGVSAGVRDIPSYMESTAISQRVFYANRKHPGAAHYLIHGVDDPTHAPLGLEAAFTLYQVAPDAGHSLHMTSHIFNAMGMWSEQVHANRDAIRVVEKQSGKKLYIGHYPSWLLYGLLQENKFNEARQNLELAYNEITESKASAAGEPWDVNLTQELTLIPDATYVLRFRAKSAMPRSINVGLGLAYSPYTNVSNTTDLTTDWQSYQYEITTEGFGGENCSAFFFMGSARGAVFLDDISLVLQSTKDDGGEKDVNLLTNGSFEKELEGWKQAGVSSHSTAGKAYKADVEPKKLLGGSSVSAVVSMWSRYLFEVREVDSDLLNWEFRTDGAYYPELGIHYVKGMLSDDAEAIARHLKEFKILKKELNVRLKARPRLSPQTQLSLDGLEVVEQQLMASLAKAKGKMNKALSLAREADRLEGSMPYSFGPPRIAYPSAQLLGEWLLETGDYKGAAESFREQLLRARNKTLAVKGLQQAESMMKITRKSNLK